MFDTFLDFLFPRNCSICSKKGKYICERCKKLFKRTLPECYVCRRLSTDYKTHHFCKCKYSLDSIFVSWEYNSLTSSLLKNYKYKSVYDISEELSQFFVKSIYSSNFKKLYPETLIVNIPISYNRLQERGFNQTYDLAKTLAEKLDFSFSDNLLNRKNTYEHQALKDKTERESLEEVFFIQNRVDKLKFRSITLVDDVISTGSTLEAAVKTLRKEYGEDLEINGICMFRGKAYYSENSKFSISTSTISNSPSSFESSSSSELS